MNIDPIDIQIEDKRRYGLIAFLVDRDVFLRDLKKAREKLNITEIPSKLLNPVNLPKEQGYDKIENRLDKMYEDRLDGSITQEKYDSLLAKYKQIQADILLQMEQHSKADENYYVETSRLLELASRAYELLESSEPQQKRELLTFLLQNSKMKGDKLIPTLQMPFDAILLANKTQNWLPLLDTLRTFNYSLEKFAPIFL